VPEGGQWFVLTIGDSGNIEKLLLSQREPEVAPQEQKQDPPEQPPQQAEPITIEDQEPTGNYKSPPVICPTCGKQFRSAGRMAKAKAAHDEVIAAVYRAQADAAIIEGQNESERLRQDGQTALVKQIMGWAVAILSVVFIGVFLWRLATGRRAVDYRESGDSIERDEAEQPLPDFAAGVKTGLFANIVTREELRKIGSAVLSGRPFSHAQIVRTLGVMSEDDFTALQDKFIIYGLATWRNAEHHKQGCIITPKGNQFFVDIGCLPTSPFKQDAPVAPELGDKDTIRDGFTPIQ
jgi:hypothetical protein